MGSLIKPILKLGLALTRGLPLQLAEAVQNNVNTRSRCSFVKADDELTV